MKIAGTPGVFSYDWSQTTIGRKRAGITVACFYPKLWPFMAFSKKGF
jgi:hypothetical protein